MEHVSTGTIEASLHNEDLLRQVSEDVTSVEEAQEIIAKVDAELGRHSNGIGLSAIQIGIPKRISVLQWNDPSGKRQTYHLINAKITELRDEFVHVGEGCLSFPQMFADVKRYEHVTIENHEIVGEDLVKKTAYFYYDKKQEWIKHSPPILAIAIQHEIDHFDGVLCYDKSVKVQQAVSKKVGRNDPCPCGSGKKYKKCCLR